MSKVICDVCGTTYPDTSSQCPICNSAKSSVDNTGAGDAGEHAYVKGGRFSKKNVKKRGKTTAQRRSSGRAPQNDEPSNTGLVIVVILLLLAIVAVVIYIGVHFFGSSNVPENTTPPNKETTTQTAGTTETTVPEDTSVACEKLQLSNQIIEFTEKGETWTLVVGVTPVDTTDAVVFTSTDENVVTVTSNGVITAVGGGEATVIVSCGDIAAGCQITCSFEEPTTQPSEPEGTTSTEPTETTPSGEFNFKWNTAYVDANGVGDVSLDKQGSTWKAYKSSLTIDVKDITWTSDDEKVCTFVDGVVTAVGRGTTKIHATYNGVTYDCIIRCTFAESAPETEETQPAESQPTETQPAESQPTETQPAETQPAETQPAETTGEKCTINKTDVTIKVGESFKLTLKDSKGNVLDITWTAAGDNVTIDGNAITGAKAGTTKVSVTHNGETYTCIVRVIN